MVRAVGCNARYVKHDILSGQRLKPTLQSSPTSLHASELPSGFTTVSAGGIPSTAGVPGTVVPGSDWLLTPGIEMVDVRRFHEPGGHDVFAAIILHPSKLISECWLHTEFAEHPETNCCAGIRLATHTWHAPFYAVRNV